MKPSFARGRAGSTIGRVTNDDWITAAVAAELTGYTVRQVRRWAEAGKLKARKWGDVWQVSKAGALAHAKHLSKAGKKRGRKLAIPKG